MEPEAKQVANKVADAQAEVGAIVEKPKNLYNRMEWAGASRGVGTLIPFVVAYITIVKKPPLGLLFMFGISLIASGLYYRTPIPIQPMKAIGAAAIAVGISPAAHLRIRSYHGAFLASCRSYGDYQADCQTCDQTRCSRQAEPSGAEYDQQKVI